MKNLILAIACAAIAASAAAQGNLAVGKSVFVGANVEIDEAVTRNLTAAGGRIDVNAPVAGSARLAGGHVHLGPNAAISKNASLAGGKVTVSGSVSGNLHAAGGHITLDGPVGGDASIAAGTLELGPNARIGGVLSFRGGHLERDPAAEVAGGIRHRDGYGHRHESMPFGHSGSHWVWTVGLMLLAGIIAAALPGPSNLMASELRARPWMAPLLGFIALTCIPVAAVLAMITIIGIPLGLLALLGYVILLLVGYVFISVVIGAMLLDRFKADVAANAAWRVGAAVLAMLAIALLARIPVIGALVVFSALVVGVGLIVAVTWRNKRPGDAPAPA